MNPQDTAAASVIAHTIIESLTPLLVAFTCGVFGWATWMTWTLREVHQTVKGSEQRFADLESQIDGVEEHAEAHRQEDGRNFREVHKRIDDYMGGHRPVMDS